MRYVIWQKSEPRFVIMQKAGLSTNPELHKVKVPVKRKTGRTFSGYRYKKLDIPVESEPDKLNFLTCSWKTFFGDLLKQNVVERELIGIDSYVYSATATWQEDKKNEYNKFIQERSKRKTIWGIPVEAATEQGIKASGVDYMEKYWKEHGIGEHPATEEFKKFVGKMKNKYGQSWETWHMKEYTPEELAEYDKIREAMIEESSKTDSRKKFGVKVGTEWIDPNDIQHGWAHTANDHGWYSSDLLQAAMALRLPDGSYNEPDGVAWMKSRMLHSDIDSSWVRQTLQSWKISDSDVYAYIKDHPEKYKGKMGLNEAYKDAKVDMVNMLWPLPEDTIKAANAYLDGVYERTQKVLGDMGYKPDDTIFLYRGVGQSLNKFEDGKILTNYDYRLNPLSSWTADPRVVLDFGNNMMVAEVKVKDIWSGFFTGMGCLNESEFILPATAVKRFKLFRLKE